MEYRQGWSKGVTEKVTENQEKVTEIHVSVIEKVTGKANNLGDRFDTKQIADSPFGANQSIYHKTRNGRGCRN